MFLDFMFGILCHWQSLYKINLTVLGEESDIDQNNNPVGTQLKIKYHED